VEALEDLLEQMEAQEDIMTPILEELVPLGQVVKVHNHQMVLQHQVDQQAQEGLVEMDAYV
jgi:hypothetical protein